MNELNAVMTASEVVQFYGLSDAAVRKAINDSRLADGTYRKSGGTWLILKSEARKVFGRGKVEVTVKYHIWNTNIDGHECFRKRTWLISQDEWEDAEKRGLDPVTELVPQTIEGPHVRSYTAGWEVLSIVKSGAEQEPPLPKRMPPVPNHLKVPYRPGKEVTDLDLAVVELNNVRGYKGKPLAELEETENGFVLIIGDDTIALGKEEEALPKVKRMQKDILQDHSWTHLLPSNR